MKALSVFSGGLDSMLAAALVRAQKVEVQALFFETPFFSSGKAKQSADHLDLPIKVIDITERHLKVVQSPRHGYGANMNPCIDCHSLMFRIAGEMLEEEGASFVISGEVLGQRPMSQNKGALDLVARESGLGSLLLRPLSAKHLAPSEPETEGWVKRDLLLDLKGRSRKPQMELATKLNIHEYPSPAGGCLLTEKAFSRRLRHLLNLFPSPEIFQIELLKFGRHFRLGQGTKLVVGRNKDENQRLFSLAAKKAVTLKPISVPGPTAVLSGLVTPSEIELALEITAAYSDSEGKASVEMMICGEKEEQLSIAPGKHKRAFRALLI
jgi:tRNA-uridine 2-sulfurtransferase